MRLIALASILASTLLHISGCGGGGGSGSGSSSGSSSGGTSPAAPVTLSLAADSAFVRTTGKLFWVSRASQNSLGVSAYARNRIALLGFVEIPLRVVNDFVTGVNSMPNNRLAIVTAAGHLIILHGALFAP